jgi:hypothetical protein
MTFLCCAVNFFITSTKCFNENLVKAVLLTQPVVSDLTYEKNQKKKPQNKTKNDKK